MRPLHYDMTDKQCETYLNREYYNSKYERILREYILKVTDNGRMPISNFLKEAQIETLLKNEPKTIQDLIKLPGFPEKGATVNKHGSKLISIFNN